MLYTKQLTDLMDMKLFVDEEDDIRLARRCTWLCIYHSHTSLNINIFTVKRDIAERGRDIKGVLEQYEKFVKPAFDDYILPVSITPSIPINT